MIRAIFLLLVASSAFAAEIDGNHCHVIENGSITDTYAGDCQAAPPPPPPPSGNCRAPDITGHQDNHTCDGWPGETMAVKTGSGGGATNYVLNNMADGRTVCLEAGSVSSDLSISTSHHTYWIEPAQYVSSLTVSGSRLDIRGQISGSINVTGNDVVVNGQCYNGTL